MGVVEAKQERLTKAGVTYDLTVDNIKYGFFTSKPACEQGDTVSFSASKNGNFWNANAKSLKLVERASATTIQGSTGTPSVSNQSQTNTTKPAWIPDKDRQDSIIYQSSRKDAIAFLQLLQANGLIDVGKSKSIAGKMAALEIFLDGYTHRFFEDTKNLGHKAEDVPPEETTDSHTVSVQLGPIGAQGVY